MADGVDGADSVIIAEYLAGVSVPKLARRHHRGHRTIARILRAADVEDILRRRAGEARRGFPSPAHLRHGGLPVGALDAPHWAYVAGLLDGEGSIVARRAPGGAGRGHARYVVSIAQKDPAPLLWLRDALGAGALQYAAGTHRYHLRPQRAVADFLRAVAPYLVVKRTTAEAAREPGRHHRLGRRPARQDFAGDGRDDDEDVSGAAIVG